MVGKGRGRKANNKVDIINQASSLNTSWSADIKIIGNKVKRLTKPLNKG